MDYEEIQEILNQIMAQKEQFRFEDLVNYYMSGEGDFSAGGILGAVLHWLDIDFGGYRALLLQLLIIGIIAAVLAGFSEAFKNKQVAETGFFMTYLLLFSMIMASFYQAAEIARGVTGKLLQFMEALVPTYLTAVAFSTGGTTSMAFYQGILILITLVDKLVLSVFLPLANVYLVIMLANHLAKEDSLSKLAGLLKQLLWWGMKAVMGLVLGFQAIQGMVLPAMDHLKRSALYRGVSMIPGVGGLVGGTTQTVLSAGLLVKNAVGAAGFVVILLLCLIPVSKLVIQYFLYRLSEGVLQPISDKRITACLAASAEAAKLLLYLVLMSAGLFLVTIAIIAVSTNLA